MSATVADAGRDGEPLTTEMMHRLSGDLDYKRIAADWVEVPDRAQPVWVSTVWTGHDGGPDEYGRTLIFETLLWFGPHLLDAGVRATTRREAYENHQLVIRHLTCASDRLAQDCDVQVWADGPEERACRLARHLGLDPDRVPEDAIIDERGYMTHPVKPVRDGAAVWLLWHPSIPLSLRIDLSERAHRLRDERVRHLRWEGRPDDCD